MHIWTNIRKRNFAIFDYLIVCNLVNLIHGKIGKLRFGHQVSFSPTKGLLESWYWARPAEMEENKEEEEEGWKIATEVGDLFPVAWKRSSRALSWQLREVSASVTKVTENFPGIMKISSTECEKFVKIAKKCT